MNIKKWFIEFEHLDDEEVNKIYRTTRDLLTVFTVENVNADKARIKLKKYQRIYLENRWRELNKVKKDL